MKGGVTTDFPTILQAIGSFGFPIATCLMCFWYIKETAESHKQEIEKMAEALQNNTLALQRLSDKLEVKRNE